MKISNIKYQISNISKGFTLIELLVVISIIGILIGLSIFGLQGARAGSRDAKRKADLELIRSGIEIFKSDCNRYPLSDPPANATGILATSGTSLIGDGTSVSCATTNTYISQIPPDPIDPALYYVYFSTDGTKYNICAHLEQVSGVTVSCDGSGNPTQCGTSGDANSVCNYMVTNP